MGCSTCGKSRLSSPNYQLKFYPNILNNIEQAQQIDESCEYTLSQLQTWLSKLICCKDTGLYISLNIKPSTLNKYLGNVGSAINYKSHLCFFKKELDVIANIIIIIENSGKC